MSYYNDTVDVGLLPLNGNIDGSSSLPTQSLLRLGRRRRNFLKLVGSTLGFACISSDLPSRYLFSITSVVRQLCTTTIYPGDSQKDPFWEKSFPADTFYLGGTRILPSGSKNIGFVVTLESCPEDRFYKRNLAMKYDPGHALYDAAAVLMHSIDENLGQTGKYTYTMHAIIHPDAVICKDPNAKNYDRVKVLESLGYYVNIQASLVDPVVDPVDRYIAANIDTDAGDRDLTVMYAGDYDNHPAVAIVNFDTVIMNAPLDPILDRFLADENAKIGTSFQPDNSIDMGFLLLKPDPEFIGTIKDTYINTSYDPTTGWGGTGIGGFAGALGSKGVLTYYTSNLDPQTVMTFDTCIVANNHEGECLNTSSEDIVVAKLSTCGSPWHCPDLSTVGLDTPEERAKCTDILKQWYTMREDFENNCWIGAPLAPRLGTFQSGVSLGFCRQPGILGYSHMIVDKSAPESCDTETHSTYTTNVLTLGQGASQDQKLTLTTGVHTGSPRACVSGAVTKSEYQPPFNICLVIDVSGSTSENFQGTTVGDTNGDNASNTILDAEIASILQILQTITDSDGLGNDNVSIGLVVFSTGASYLGMHSPSDPNDPTKINPALENELKRLRSDGYTHFDSALDKAVEFFQEAPSGRSNLMFFLSDGIPNIPGDGDNEEHVHPTDHHLPANMFESELAVLDEMNVFRLAVGVGSGSDVRPEFGLDMIDNTPDEINGQNVQQATSAEALSEVLLSNPVLGSITDFKVEVNGVIDPQFGPNSLKSSFAGFEFGPLIVGNLNPLNGQFNVVKVSVTIDSDGDMTSITDQHTMTVESVILGGLI